MRDMSHEQDHQIVHLTVIKPSAGWRFLGIQELWQFRELLQMMTLRDIKIRYKQTVLGVLWAILQPLVAMVVFTIVLNHGAGVSSSPGIPYPIYSYSGLLIWLYFAEAVNRGSKSLVQNNMIVSKVYFPRLIAPISSIFSPLFDFIFAFLILVALMLTYGFTPTWTMVCMPFFLLVAIITALGFSVWLAALNVQYRDVGYAVPIFLQLGLFLTPVVVSPTHLHGVIKVIYSLNPMAGVVLGFRWSVLGVGTVPWTVVLPSLGVMVLVLAAGVTYFRRVERTFADAI